MAVDRRDSARADARWVDLAECWRSTGAPPSPELKGQGVFSRCSSTAIQAQLALRGSISPDPEAWDGSVVRLNRSASLASSTLGLECLNRPAGEVAASCPAFLMVGECRAALA